MTPSGNFDEISAYSQPHVDINKSNIKLKNLIDNIPGVVYSCYNDENWTMEFCSPNIYHLTGYHPEELVDNAKLSFNDLILAEDRERVYSEVQEQFRENFQFRVEYRITTTAGETKWVWEQGKLVSEEDEGGNELIEGIILDITERKKMEYALKKSEEKYRTVLENVAEGYFEVDLAGNFTFFNNNVAECFGYPPDELLGMNNRDYTSEETGKELFNDFHRIYLTEEPLKLKDYEIITKEGERKVVQLSAHLMKDDYGNPTGFQGVARDVTLIRKAERDLHWMAFYDKLTGLPNRELFKERFKQAQSSTTRHQKKLGLFFIDMDGLKDINDSMGHIAGDELIICIANRLSSIVREKDSLARFSGDEFIFLAQEIDDLNDAQSVGQRIRQALIEPCFIQGRQIHPEASIGFSIYPDYAEDLEELLRQADIAMYKVKEKNKQKVQAYQEEVEPESQQQRNLESRLQKALTNREFVIHYQAQMDLVNNSIAGFEALLRWQHPQKGLLYPEHFLPLLEETGLISSVGEWVIDTVCEQNRNWQLQGKPPIYISINLSSKQIGKQENLIERINEALFYNNLQPHFLGFEFTESTVFEHVETLSEILQQLSPSKWPLCIDNFSASPTSSQIMRSSPIDMVKVDMSLVNELLKNCERDNLLNSIIDLAHTLNKKVLAKGVETEEQASFIKHYDCDYAQGYYFLPPLPSEEVEQIWPGKIK